MILVILGTQDKPFNRLLEAVEKQIENGIIKDKVIVQSGFTKYDSKTMEIFDLIPMKKFNQLVKEANLIITHGGVGSILGALRANKKVIAVPRDKQYKEHTNNHQKQIVNKFEELGYILVCEDLSKLDKVLKEVNKFKQKPYQGSNEKMLSTIENFIEKK